MKIVYFGSGQFGINCLDAIAPSRHSIELIVTQPPRGAGRGRKTRRTAVASWAERQAVRTVATDNVNAKSIVDQVRAAEPDIIVVIAFGQKVSSELIELPPNSAINVHSSLLPKYRGAAPVNWAIINGETETGVSIITLARKMDAGHILAQEKTPIHPDETAGELHDRLAVISAPLLIETLDHIEEGTATYRIQEDSRATLAPKLKKSDGRIDFNDDAEKVRCRIRGLWPWPEASAKYCPSEHGKSIRVIIARADVVETANPQKLPPGSVDEDLNVICARNALHIRQIKPEGSRLMHFKAFVNGRNVRPGDVFRKLDD